jgi:undecaprenyl diphosphate synthase
MALFSSSTRSTPENAAVPRHIAIIMDGNGRWAKRRFLPRFAGHKKGVDALRDMVRACLAQGVEHLTVFAFSSENWRRPQDEVSLLMQLFHKVLEQEVDKIDANGVRLRIIGDLSRFDDRLQQLVKVSEARTANNTKLNLNIAANYGGRWDIMQAVNAMLQAQPEKRDGWTEADLEPWLSMNYAPEPDLFIRTGGETRISNFLLWQLAYTELYFTDVLWPEFDAAELGKAIASFQQRERRFGRTSEQLTSAGTPLAS